MPHLLTEMRRDPSVVLSCAQARPRGRPICRRTYSGIAGVSDEVDRLAPISLSGFQEIVISNGMAAMTLKPEAALTCANFSQSLVLDHSR